MIQFSFCFFFVCFFNFARNFCFFVINAMLKHMYSTRKENQARERNLKKENDGEFEELMK